MPVSLSRMFFACAFFGEPFDALPMLFLAILAPSKGIVITGSMSAVASALRFDFAKRPILRTVP